MPPPPARPTGQRCRSSRPSNRVSPRPPAKNLPDQRDSLKLIASENYASPAVPAHDGHLAVGQVPRAPWAPVHAGCQNVDDVEAIAAEHAREPARGPLRLRSTALRDRRQPGGVLGDPGYPRRGARTGGVNQNVNDLSEAEWERLRGPGNGQRLMGMSLDAGGHHPRLPSQHLGKDVPAAQLRHQPGDRPAGLRRHRRGVREFKPLILVAGYSAYPRRVNFATMREIADDVGATLMVDMAHFAGTGRRARSSGGDEDPVPHAHVVTNHHAQGNVMRAARRCWCWPAEYSDAVDKGCPMVLRRSLSQM